MIYILNSEKTGCNDQIYNMLRLNTDYTEKIWSMQ